MARADKQFRPHWERVGEFEKEKAAGQPKPIYILRGTDPYLLGLGRQAVRRRAIGDADPGMAVLEMLGGEATLADVLDGLRTLPFLAPRRLVLIREAEEFLDEHTREALLTYLEAPSPTGVLALEVASWNEALRLAKRVAEVGLVIVCEATDPARIPAWLQGQAKARHGKTLAFGAAQMLVEYLGADFASLLHALDMLALYTGASDAIDAAEVDALVARGHHERVWDLCDAVAEGNLGKALELLETFHSEGLVAAQIVGILRPTFRQLLQVRALNRRMSLDEAMARASVHWSAARDRVRRAVGAFSEAHLTDAYQALVDADLEAKTTPNERMALETLIHRLVSPEAARAGTRSVEAS
jgi:DNA polymerase-3 subunit delta